jgi:predicted 3-demethylubiquinone-9 3-methyltransferase (glyoxalase superfamily)
VTTAQERTTTVPNIVSCLWYDDQAEQAAQLYTSIFPNSEIHAVSRYGPDTPGPEGHVMTVEFTLDGHRFLGLNGGPQFPFTEAVSFQIFVGDQTEVDYYWDALTDGGEESNCGWLKDRFGLSWQVIPLAFTETMEHGEPAAKERVMQAMLKMHRFDVAEIERAAAG